MSNSEIFELVLSCLPYATQMHDIDLGRDNEIRFTWRGDRFKVSESLHVEECKDGMLMGSTASLLLGELLKRTKLIKDMK